jgi:hypothetical protein
MQLLEALESGNAWREYARKIVLGGLVLDLVPLEERHRRQMEQFQDRLDHRECQVCEPSGLLPITHSPQCRLKTAQIETCREVGAQVLASPRFLALRLLSTMAR